MDELKRYRKMVGPLVVAFYAIATGLGFDPVIVEAAATAQIANLLDVVIPVVGLFLTYILPND